MKSTVIFAVGALMIIAFLFSLSSGKHAPLIPDDIFHSNVTHSAACRTCHTPGKQAPLKGTHPPKEECLICHKAKKAR